MAREMVERVARAICCPGGVCQARGDYDPIKGCVGICQAHTFDAEARAAIEATGVKEEVLEGLASGELTTVSKDVFFPY